MIPHLYIHVPFCTSKCHYCAFYSETGTEQATIQEYPALLQRELLLRQEGSLSPTTIYMGGGTPSLLGAEGFRKLTELLKESIRFDQLEEWSVEINPASATSDLFTAMRECGVNRLTFGVQSFHNSVLKTINRAHNAQCAIDCVKLAQKCGFDNIDIDLIAGLPGVDHTIWQEDLHKALSLNPQHLSVYSLSIEQGTKLAEMIEGGLSIADDDVQFKRLQAAQETLRSADFMRYEISNYALSGYQCRHNLGIWRGDDYLGLGPAAASRINLKRLENNPNLKLWRQALLQNKPPPHTCEWLSEEDDALQRVLFRFRLQEGFNLNQSVQQYPILEKRGPEWRKALKSMAEGGALKKIDDRWTLTGRGREVCDHVIRELM